MVMELWWRRESQNMMRGSDRGSYLTPSWCLCVCVRVRRCVQSVCLSSYTLCLSLYYPAHLNRLCTDMRSLMHHHRGSWLEINVHEGHIFWVCFYVMKAVSKCGFELYSTHNFRIDATVNSIHTIYTNLTFSAHFLRIETHSWNPQLLMSSFIYLGLCDECSVCISF